MDALKMPSTLASSMTSPSLQGISADILKSQGQEKLKEAAKKFEAVFVHKLLGAMRETVPNDGLFGDGISKQMQDMYWMFMGDEMAKRGSLGMWKELSQQFGCDENALDPSQPAEVEVMK